jgi:SAM-dependent methyltransferase
MKPLTDRQHWDSLYDSRGASLAPVKLGRLKSAVKRLLGPNVLEYMRDYRDYLLWDVMYPKFLVPRRGAKVLEVGSAPGRHLIRLRDVFGFEPFGVEYSPAGAELNRRLFEQHGISTDNVIQEDFCSPQFQSKYENRFDVVVSNGFIEHFTDVEGVVAKHVNVLAPGGRLVVTIPNLRGANYVLAWLFCKDLIPLHNLSIMRRDRFRKLFLNPDLTPLLCGYFGTFSFGIFNTRPESKRRYLLMICDKVQRLLNAVFRLLFGARGAESRYFSPYLIFVAVKER